MLIVVSVPPKKNKSSSSSSSRSQRKSSRKNTSSRKSNNNNNNNDQLVLNDDLLQNIDQLDDALIESFGRDYYLFVIKHLETQVNAYEDYIQELSKENEKLLTKYYTSDFECQEQFKMLNKLFQERINEAADLTERIQAMQCVFKTNLDKWKARENELEMLKKSTEETMKAENIAIANQLASLEEFRLNREVLWRHYYNLESTLNELRNEHKLAMENLLERDLAYRGRLKKVTKLKINEVASEFRSVSFQRTEPTIKRMLAENVSIEGQLVKLSVAIADISRENVDLLTEFYNLTEEQTNLEKEQILLSTRNSAILKVSHLLSIFQAKLDQKIKEADEKNKIYLNLNNKCNELEHEKQLLNTKVEELIDQRDQMLSDLHKINKISVDCSNSIHHLTECIAYAADCIQTMLSTHVNQSLSETCQPAEDTTTTDQLENGNTNEILFKLYDKLNSTDCIMNKYDTILLDFYDNENEIQETTIAEPNNDNLSDISEPNYQLDIDETMPISEPEDVDEKNENIYLDCRKSMISTKLESMERLDKIWSQINTSYLQSYNPASNEWKEILNILAKNQINWIECLKNTPIDLHGGYLKPGDLKFIPPPSLKILSKKEYMSSLRKRERIASCRRKLTDNIPDYSNESRSKSIGVQTRIQSKSKLRFE
ncbi:unnamed protein product [Schistosoma turkestanicum]|nr:unnamed protein product [Schistosoma turkestanicum]